MQPNDRRSSGRDESVVPTEKETTTARNTQLGTHKYIVSHMDIADWTAHHRRAV